MGEGYVTCTLTEGDIDECIRVAARSYEVFSDSSALRGWFNQRILNNPWQHALPGIGVGTRYGGELVGFRAMFAQPWWLDGKPDLIAFAAHTCVDPQHRGAGLGGRLIAHSQSFATLTGSTSAGDITQRAYRKLGFIEIGGPDNHFYRLRCSYRGSMQTRLGGAAGGIAGALADLLLRKRDRQLGHGASAQGGLQHFQRCGSEFDELWQRARGGQRSCLEHSSRYLNWRLFDHPTADLRLSGIQTAQGALRAFGVWTIQRYSEFVSAAVLRDLFHDAADAQAPRALLRELLAHWRQQGLSWVNLEVASPQLTPLFGALGYEHVPSKGNRYQISSATPLTEEAQTGWLRSGLDGDYFDFQESVTIR